MGKSKFYVLSLELSGIPPKNDVVFCARLRGIEVVSGDTTRHVILTLHQHAGCTARYTIPTLKGVPDGPKFGSGGLLQLKKPQMQEKESWL